MVTIKSMLVLAKLDTGAVHQVVIPREEIPTLMSLVEELSGGKIKVLHDPISNCEIREAGNEEAG